MKNLLLLIVCFACLQLQAQDKAVVLKGNALFGDLKARQIGPAIMSGRLTDIELHPTNPKVIYAGSAGGGVWKSQNGGMSFQPIFDKHAQSIGKVKLDPKQPDKVIWVGTGEIWTRNSTSVGDGLYKSIDGGVNFKRVGFERSERIGAIEIDPNNSNTIYVGVLGQLWSDSDERGVYKSTDGGATWNKILYVDEKTGCTDLVMDVNDPNTLYASMWEHRRTAWSFSSGGMQSALYKSTDGGATWNKIHNGFPEGQQGRIAFAQSPSNPKRLYAVLETEKDEDKGLYRSDDGGNSWSHLNNDFGLVVRPFYFSRIVVDPKNPDLVVKGGLYGSISRDGGKTFKNLGRMHPDIHDVAFNANNSDQFYVATDGGFYRTNDGGITMEICDNLPISQFYHVAVDQKEPYNIYGGLQDNGSWYGPSSSPGGIEGRDWNVVGYGDGFRVLPHPTKNILYSEMQGAENVWRFDIDKQLNKTVQPLPGKDDPKLRFNWNAPMSTSVHQPDRFYMGSQFLHVSEDMGDTWKKISPDLTTNDPKKQDQENSGGLSKDNSGAENHCTIFTIAESPKNDQVIWVGTDDGNVQVTKNGGKKWTNTIKNIKGLPANTWCYHIEASVHNEGTAYAVFEGHTTGDPNPYCYKTTDYGATWKSIITDDVYGFARSIQEDFVNPDLLFLGTEFGLYITINGGKSWNKFENNMPAVAIHHLTMQPKTNDLVMGTHGRGIIILDDVSPLRQITPDVLTKNVHFFKPQPMVIKEKSPFGGTATELEFVGPNKSDDAKIVYYLKKKHIFGKLTMEIQDMDGNKLIDLNAGKSRGINVVTWNGLLPSPKSAKAKGFSFGGFTSPRAKAGTYKVVMNRDKERYETTIELKNDPKSFITAADRKKQHDVTMKLYNMTEDLAYMVYQIDEMIAKSEEVDAMNLKASLESLKETLVTTTGDNYVGAAEPQLKEKMSKIYAKIASQYDAPSASEMDNIAVIETRYNKAVADFKAIEKQEKATLASAITAKGAQPLSFKSKAEFLKR